MKKIKAPFPWFGGKSQAADLIWEGLGQVENYIEPFCGSLAVLLSNPSTSKIETVNDADCFLVNFWRCISNDPEQVVKYADYPILEADLHARHKWMLSNANDDFRSKMNDDPHFCDFKMAGWWIWGIGASIPGNFLQSRGINSIPCLSSAGGGIHGLTNDILEWFKIIQDRIRRVRVCCGDYQKILSPAITYKNKGLGKDEITGIFLDPPYDLKDRSSKLYQEDKDIYSQVCQWAIQNGETNKLRIAVCGYQNDVVFPDTWQQVPWKANGGLGNRGQSNSPGKVNANREMIYFSTNCLKIK